MEDRSYMKQTFIENGYEEPHDLDLKLTSSYLSEYLNNVLSSYVE